MKKFLAVLLAMALLFSLSIQAFAYSWPAESYTINWSYTGGDYANGDHTGTDIAPLNSGVSGDNIYAFYDGTMTKFKWDTKAGYTSHIAHTNPESTGAADKYLLSRNQHQLNPASNGFDTSGAVSEGDLIGYMGETGSTANGVHLHFETLVNNNAYTASSGWYTGAFVDPVDTFFPGFRSLRSLNQIEPLSSETPKVGITVGNRFYDARGLATMSENDLAIHGITANQIAELLPKLKGKAEYVNAYSSIASLANK